MNPAYEVSIVEPFPRVNQGKLKDYIMSACSRFCELLSPKQLKLQYPRSFPTSRRSYLWRAILLEHGPVCSASEYEELKTLPCSCDASIQRDLARTQPQNDFFLAPGGEGQQTLFNVLRACANRCTDITYCQGMNFLAASLLLVLDETSTFQCFVSLLETYHLKTLFLPAFPKLKVTLFVFDCLVEAFLPDIFRFLKAHGIKSDFYSVHAFMTLFTYDLPHELLVAVLDQFFLHGWEVIFKVALLLLSRIQDRLFSLPHDEALRFVKLFTSQGSFGLLPDELLQYSDKFLVNNKMLTSLEEALYQHGRAMTLIIHEDPTSNIFYWEIKIEVTVRSMDGYPKTLPRRDLVLYNSASFKMMKRDKWKNLPSKRRGYLNSLDSKKTSSITIPYGSSKNSTPIKASLSEDIQMGFISKHFLLRSNPPKNLQRFVVPPTSYLSPQTSLCLNVMFESVIFHDYFSVGRNLSKSKIGDENITLKNVSSEKNKNNQPLIEDEIRSCSINWDRIEPIILDGKSLQSMLYKGHL
ncbi:TBC domain-containing protein [Cardiosporidium cionae]|uniref:TBC domain-containing protein n=1 Tax=Cardiosporidium cionae TaxID=476202 RepID=A0ABQ7JBC7_9APIC|nr:TBC domain-containing protein [Cardiosporidium cionae]|eukprot:KAF8821307.1 TBC domain-containing protein [Cardiosporidium cionae]